MYHTSIEWVQNPDGSIPGWAWNPLTGCLNGCEYCYARKLANTRLRERYLANLNVAPAIEGWEVKSTVIGSDRHYLDARYLDPFYPRFWPERLTQPLNKAVRRGQTTMMYGHKARGIFTCDMSDLFGIGVPPGWTQQVLKTIRDCADDRFYLLTKQAHRLTEFSPFPENCYVGVTATDMKMAEEAGYQLSSIKASVKYISFEPLLGPVSPMFADWLTTKDFHGIDWLIIGAQTKPAVYPKIEWVREIVEAADKAGIPVFLKNNLEPLMVQECGDQRFAPLWANGGNAKLRQEMP